jgi:hypothetical protein
MGLCRSRGGIYFWWAAGLTLRGGAQGIFLAGLVTVREMARGTGLPISPSLPSAIVIDLPHALRSAGGTGASCGRVSRRNTNASG